MGLTGSIRGICAIVQARVGSTRLPGKVLQEIEGVPLLTHVLRRTKAAKKVAHFVLAIPSTSENDPLVAIGEAEGFTVYRGDETDVLARFWWASQLYPDDKIIVRITADDPYKDPTLIDLACEMFLKEWEAPTEKSPHYLNIGGPTWPVGMDVEVFSRGALNVAHQLAQDPAEREHVTLYIAYRFGSWTLRDPFQRRSVATRWTIDTQDDLDMARLVYAELYAKNPVFGMEELCEAGIA